MEAPLSVSVVLVCVSVCVRAARAEEAHYDTCELVVHCVKSLVPCSSWGVFMPVGVAGTLTVAFPGVLRHGCGSSVSSVAAVQ